MPARLEITLKPDLFDAEGAAVCRKANDYFGLGLVSVRTVSVLTIDAELDPDQFERIRTDIFTNPVSGCSFVVIGTSITAARAGWLIVRCCGQGCRPGLF